MKKPPVRSTQVKSTRNRSRAAFSLIESVAMMAFVASLLSISGVAIHQTSKLQTLSLSFIRQEKLLDDFQRQLRNDARAAKRQSILPDQGVMFQVGEHRVEYSLDDTQSIVRRVQNATGEPLGINRWRVGAEKVSFKMETQEKRPLLHCQLFLSHTPPQTNLDSPLAGLSQQPTSDEASKDATINKSNTKQPEDLRVVHWLFRVGVHP